MTSVVRVNSLLDHTNYSDFHVYVSTPRRRGAEIATGNLRFFPGVPATRR